MTSASLPWLFHARLQLARGDLRGALETLRRALAEDPEEAHAHALLALVLLALKRPHAAAHEAGLALGLAPELPLAHSTAASVALAQRRFPDAERHITRLLELEPDSADPLLLQARLLGLRGERARRREVLERAVALAPEDPDALVALGEDALERGDLKEAEARAREVLTLQPESQEALVLMGQVWLRRGRVEEAREHALWVLRQDATDTGALRLLASLKARQNPLLGLWWRYAMFMGELGSTRGMVVLLGAFVAYRFATLAARDLGQPGLASVIQLVWLALVVYSWVGPALFQRMVRQELETVRLDPRF